jgi:hypothetical protein
MLLDYNATVNENPEFSIWKVCQRLYDEMHEDMYVQKNSGMLGVHGNIGFSTAYHAFHMEVGIKKDSGCCVGDDGAGAPIEDPSIRFIPHIQLAGTMSVKKSTILPPLQEFETEQVAKFVKRRLTRNHDGISIGFLLAFPSFASAFDIKDQYHSHIDEDRTDIILKFIGQVSSLFWDLFQKGWMEPEEQRLLELTLTIVYRRLGLPHKGCLPGSRHADFREGIPMAVPSLTTNVSMEDWAEALWSSTSQRWTLLPMTLGNPCPPPYCQGMFFESKAGAFVNALEDIGCLRKVRMMTEWVEVNETNRRLFRNSFDSTNRVYQYQYLDVCPRWFELSLAEFYRVPTLLRSLFSLETPL